MSGETDLVSFLTPVWNEAQHIEVMLRSLQDQPCPNWEVVLVDDGSTDTTIDIIRRLSRTDPRIRLVHSGAKLGKVPAFNLAFARSRGSIITHLGGDDVATSRAVSGRIEALGPHADTKAAAYFKLRMFSEDPDHGTVLPRGGIGSRTGPSTTMTRQLAEILFPIPEDLPSEDLWLGEGSHGLAATVTHSPHVVVNYRVHGGNSNPRAKSFAQMSEAIHARMHYAPKLLSETRFDLSDSKRMALTTEWETEKLRKNGDTLALLLRSDLDVFDRLALAAMSNARLWWVRQGAGALFSGWRGR